MIKQRILATIWLLFFSSILVFWFSQFVNKVSPEPGYFRVIASPFLLFGSIACIFLFRGVKWARISVGVIALFVLALIIWMFFNHEYDELSVGLGVFALITAWLLLFSKHARAA